MTSASIQTCTSAHIQSIEDLPNNYKSKITCIIIFTVTFIIAEHGMEEGS